MAQQTFSGVPGAFSPGEVLSAADQELLRDYLIAQIKEGQTGDTGEVLPMIMDLTNNRIVLDSGGLEFSDATTMTTAATGITFAGTTADGMLTYSSGTEIATESTATYTSDTLTLSGSGGGLKLDNLASSNANTLDDYEEGTWTPTLTCGTSGTITLDGGWNTGGYVKVGRLVTVFGQFHVASVSSPLGILYLGGLPFTTLSMGAHAEETVSSLLFAGVDVSNNDTSVWINLTGAASCIGYGTWNQTGGQTTQIANKVKYSAFGVCISYPAA